MIKRKIIAPLLFLLLYTFLYGAEVEHLRYKWKSTMLAPNTSIFFVSGKSDNFWLCNSRGTLFNINKDTVRRYSFPTGQLIQRGKYIKIGDKKFIFVGTSANWKGIINEFDNGKWKKENIDINFPLSGSIKFKNTYYVYGDFGTLLRLVKNKWEKIPTPFNSHCLVAVIYNNKMIIITATGEVYDFDGKSFGKITIPNGFSMGKEVKKIDGMLYFYSFSGKIFSLQNDSLKRIETPEIKRFFEKNLGQHFGFVTRYICNNNITRKISYPKFFNIIDVKFFTDSPKALLLSSDGNFYIGTPFSDIDFVDLTQYYRVGDSPNSKNIFAQFCDVNNDGVCDLFLVNRSEESLLSFYQGVNNYAFANITSITGLPFNMYEINFAAISDVDKDGYPDVILQIKDKNRQKIQIYINEGNSHFSFNNEYELIDDFQLLGLRDFSLYDYDNDGDNDIILSSYYGEKFSSKGFVVIYKNNSWGNFSEIDTSLKKTTEIWNEKTIFADVNNDNQIDFFTATSWVQNRLFINRNGNFVNETNNRLPVIEKTETKDALFSDFDNDGDLDLFTIGINDFVRVYENNGRGYFKEITSRLFDSKYFSNHIIITTDLNMADFNNDGFTDMVVTVVYKSIIKNYIFLNKKGNKFTEIPLKLGAENNPFKNSTLADIDNDGDIDIYRTSRAKNILWLNTLDNNNSIEIKLKTVVSAPNGIGSKIWVYAADTTGKLIGYKQVGTEKIKAGAVDDFTVHFGLDTLSECNIKVLFPSGKEKTLFNVKVGTRLTIDEYPALLAAFYQVPGIIYRFTTKTENQLYFLLILISHLMIFFGVQIGTKKMNWSFKMAYLLLFTNLVLFWITLYASSFAEMKLTRYFAPLLLTFLVVSLPLMLSYFFQKNTRKDITGYNDRLLKLIMAFAHGEWALRNLNSIILLCSNAPDNYSENKEFINKLEARFKTFLEMTSVSIMEIMELEKLLDNENKDLLSLNRSLTIVKNEIEKFKTTDSLASIIVNLENIRKLVKILRENIYARFSSEPTEVINNLVENYNQLLSSNNITLQKVKRYPSNIPVLIKGYELGNIIDNLFQNSIRFMQNSKTKIIEIELLKESPKIIIRFSNTGTPIPPDSFESIFEQGFSGSNSTGIGLYQARKILTKYGGRIYVEKSNTTITTFRIELNEGKKENIRDIHE